MFAGFLHSLLFSTLKMEVICSSETSVDFHRFTRGYIPKNTTLHIHHFSWYSCHSCYIHISYSYDPPCFDGPNNIGEDGKILIIYLFLYVQSIKTIALKTSFYVKYEVLRYETQINNDKTVKVYTVHLAGAFTTYN
jgi:hypothetical protein